jgi:hypothetical protein
LKRVLDIANYEHHFLPHFMTLVHPFSSNLKAMSAKEKTKKKLAKTIHKWLTEEKVEDRKLCTALKGAKKIYFAVKGPQLEPQMDIFEVGEEAVFIR